jgi:myb proto-oncogene protein
MGLDPSTHAPIAEANPTAPQGSEALALTRHKAQWENARLEAEARLSRESLLMSSNSAAGYHTNNSTVETTTMPNDNPPADYFLKIWNSEAGKAFRKENQ